MIAVLKSEESNNITYTESELKAVFNITPVPKPTKIEGIVMLLSMPVTEVGVMPFVLCAKITPIAPASCALLILALLAVLFVPQLPPLSIKAILPTNSLPLAIKPQPKFVVALLSLNKTTLPGKPVGLNLVPTADCGPKYLPLILLG